MWFGTKSLRFKLSVLYIVFALVVMAGMLCYVEYNNMERDAVEVLRQAEIGPGFLNGADPTSSEVLEAVKGSGYYLTVNDIINHMERYEPLNDDESRAGFHVHLSAEPAPVGHNFYNIILELTELASGDFHTVGPITVPEGNFPETVASLTTGSPARSNVFYYREVDGYENVIQFVSLDRTLYSIRGLWQRVKNDMWLALPFILVASVAFGLSISWLTTRPLKRITLATEALSHSDLSRRVEVKSDDEIGRLARAFNTMADRLEEAFRKQKQFVSDAAHELRTPLASMKTSITKAMSADNLTPGNQELLELLSGRIDHMEDLVNDLLFLSRVDEDKFIPGDAILDVSAVVTEAGDSFRCLFEDRQIQFTSSIEPALQIRGERGLLLRVLSNLLDNAARHTPSGGEVVLEAGRKESDIVITVGDTGTGIAAEHLPHVFDRFYKAPGLTGPNDGYGLGLAITKNILESLGGKISVNSDPGRGSTFIIELPIYQQAHREPVQG